MTELDVDEVADPVAKADAYDDVITLYFSDPNVEGVILWGFSDLHHWKPDAALFEGPDYIVSTGIIIKKTSKSQAKKFQQY